MFSYNLGGSVFETCHSHIKHCIIRYYDIFLHKYLTAWTIDSTFSPFFFFFRSTNGNKIEQTLKIIWLFSVSLWVGYVRYKIKEVSNIIFNGKETKHLFKIPCENRIAEQTIDWKSVTKYYLRHITVVSRSGSQLANRLPTWRRFPIDWE